jgi:hypothetical protein
MTANRLSEVPTLRTSTIHPVRALSVFAMASLNSNASGISFCKVENIARADVVPNTVIVKPL